MIIYNLTWKEVSNLDRQTVVVVPFGTVEQHSLHLPLGSDSIIAEAIARRLEIRLPNEILVLPVIWLGCSHHHMDFPGSLTTEIDTFIKTGEAVVTSLIKHQFGNFILLNSHGGHINKVPLIAETLRHRHGPTAKVIAITYWRLISEEIQSIRETPLGGMGHACELETSLLLAIQPGLVRLDRMEADGPSMLSQFESHDMFAPGSVEVAKSFKDFSKHGGFGDPMTASAEKGERILAAVVSKLELVVREIRSGKL